MEAILPRDELIKHDILLPPIGTPLSISCLTDQALLCTQQGWPYANADACTTNSERSSLLHCHRYRSLINCTRSQLSRHLRAPQNRLSLTTLLTSSRIQWAEAICPAALLVESSSPYALASRTTHHQRRADRPCRISKTVWKTLPKTAAATPSTFTSAPQ